MTKRTKRLNITVPATVCLTLEDAAKQRGTSVLDIIRCCIRVGLRVYEAQNDPEAKMIIREGNQEREVILL